MDNNTLQEEEAGFTGKEFIAEVLQRKFLIIGIIAVCMILSYLYTAFFTETKYTSTATLHLLNAENEGTDATELSTFSYLANDFVQLIPTRSIIEKSYNSVEDKLSKKYTINQIKAALNVEKRENTRIIDVTVTLSDKEDTKILADAIAETSCKSFIASYKRELIEIADRQGPLVLKAKVRQNMLIGFFIGAVISILMLFLLKFANDKISGTEDVEKYLGLSTLATIPYNRGSKSQKSDTRKANGK